MEVFLNLLYSAQMVLFSEQSKLPLPPRKGKVRPSLCTDEIPERAGFIVQLKCCICLTKTQPFLLVFCTGPRSLQWIATNGKCCKRA